MAPVTLYGIGGTNITNLSLQGSDDGVYLYGSSINTTGGALNVTGIAGTNGNLDTLDYGVDLYGGALATTTGNLTVNGTGGNSSGYSDNPGVFMANLAAIHTTTGNITINGTGGDAGDTGVSINASGVYSDGSSGGNITITAITGLGIYLLASPGSLIGDGSTTGNITLVAGALGLNDSVTTTGNVLIKPYTGNTTIGVANSGEELNITSGILGTITAGSITIGSTSDTGRDQICKAPMTGVPASTCSAVRATLRLTVRRGWAIILSTPTPPRAT